MAGGWSSGGGGELLKDARNPWFLSNIKEVTYCLKIDEAKFGVPLSIAKENLIKAINFWKTEFQVVNPSEGETSKINPVRLATQIFKEVNCNQNVDITFQFGILSKEQKKFLQDPTKFGAITIRTNYNKQILKGTGFVYISPESGPLAFQSEGLIKKPWSRNKNILLYLTLIHELGHVFGISHMGSMGDLMSEGFVESLLIQKDLTDPAISNYYSEVQFFRFTEKSPIICPAPILLELWGQIFDLTSDEKCLQFNFLHDAKNPLFGQSEMRVIAKSDSSETSISREVTKINLNHYRFNPTFLSIIWLSDEQTLFNKKDYLKFGIPSVLGINLIGIMKTGSFIGSDHKKRILNVRFEQGNRNFNIDGILSSGKVTPIL